MIKYINTIVVGVLLLLTFTVDHIFPDKKTWQNKSVKVSIVIVIFAVVTFGLIDTCRTERSLKDEQKQNKELRSKIGDLDSKVATFEQQNMMLEMLERMHIYYKTEFNILNDKYPEGYFLFATNRYTTIPSDTIVTSRISLDWENSKARIIDNSIIHIQFINFKYHPKNITIDNLNVLLDIEAESTADGIFFDKIGLYVEWIEKREDGLIYVIGFRKVDSIPQKRTLNIKMLEYCKKLNLIRASAINTSDFEGITIQDWTITSGWE